MAGRLIKYLGFVYYVLLIQLLHYFKYYPLPGVLLQCWSPGVVLEASLQKLILCGKSTLTHSSSVLWIMYNSMCGLLADLVSRHGKIACDCVTHGAHYTTLLSKQGLAPWLAAVFLRKRPQHIFLCYIYML